MPNPNPNSRCPVVLRRRAPGPRASSPPQPRPRPLPRPSPPPRPRPVARPAGFCAGTSLLELLIAVGLFAVLTGALLSWVWTFQHSSGRLNRALERDENLRLAPLLLARYLSAAGNRNWQHTWNGLRVTGSRLEVQADLEGRDGFPDGMLSSRFERIWLEQKRTELRLRSGRGSYQPILTRISSWNAQRPTATLLVVRVEGRASPLPGNPVVDKEILDAEFFLPNYRPSLFPQEAP